MSFIARYPGHCDNCEGRIVPGDRIRATEEDWLTGEALAYVHVNCDDNDPEPVRGNQCPRCHLTMPLSGVCDCEE